MAVKSDFRKYMDQSGALPADVLLGWVVIYQIRDANYDRTVMEQAFDDLQMNGTFMPQPNNPLHAFQKATSSVNDTDYPLPNGEVAHVLVRDRREDKEVVVRQLTREIRDPRRGKLGYTPVGECVFYRPVTRNGRVEYGTERVRLTIDNSMLTKDERPALQAIVDKMNESYVRHRDFMDAMKYRAVVRSYLGYLNALKIKDGFYFIHANRADELEKLRTLVECMGGGSTLWSMPLVDLGAQKRMVIEAYEAEAEESLQDVIKAITHVKGTRAKITPAAWAKLKQQYDQAVTRSKEYQRTLKVRTITTSATQDLALDALLDLRQKLMDA